MQGQAWEALLRRIPPNYHDGLLLATVSGVELVMQSVVRIEEDYLIIRGRTAGSSDTGKVIIIPFRQINYLAFQKRLLENEIQAIFGDRDVNFADLPPIAVAPEAEEEAEPATRPPANGHAPVAANGEQPHAQPKHPSKSMLLAKLRARLAGGDSNKPKPGR